MKFKGGDLVDDATPAHFFSSKNERRDSPKAFLIILIPLKV